MELPKSLDEWTYDTIVEIVRTREFEPGEFDYKEALNSTYPGQRDQLNSSIRETACAMANGLGGYIIFGVKDRSKDPHLTDPEERIIGIPVSDDLRKNFGDKVSCVVPQIHFEAIRSAIRLPAAEGRVVYVVLIPSSPIRPHMVGLNERIFYKRGEGGSNERMDVNQIRDQMLFSAERQKKAFLLRLEIAEYRSLIVRIQESRSHGHRSLIRLDTQYFKSLLADVSVLLTIETLRELFRIPTFGNVVNQFLDRIWSFPANSPDVSLTRYNLEENLTQMDTLCGRCEQSLEQVLGPLIPSSPISE